MTTTKCISVEQLKKALDQLLEHATAYGMLEVDPGDLDEYWLVGEKERHKLNSTPDLSVGSYSDDIGELVELAEGERPPMVLDLQRIANIFQLISYQLLPPTDE